MKLLIQVVAVVLLAGCASSVTRSTPEELRSSPGSKLTFESTKPYDLAFRKTLNQMKSCYERNIGISTRMSIFGDKMDTEAQVSWQVTGMLTNKIMVTIVLEPQKTGTRVTIYSAGENEPKGIASVLRQWLDADNTGCPGDLGFSDKLESK